MDPAKRCHNEVAVVESMNYQQPLALADMKAWDGRLGHRLVEKDGGAVELSHIGARKDATVSVTAAQPPAVLLLVNDLYNLPLLQAELAARARVEVVERHAD